MNKTEPSQVYIFLQLLHTKMKFLQRLLTFITRRRPQPLPSQSTTDRQPAQPAALPTNMFHGVETVFIIGGTFTIISIGKRFLIVYY